MPSSNYDKIPANITTETPGRTSTPASIQLVKRRVSRDSQTSKDITERPMPLKSSFHVTIRPARKIEFYLLANVVSGITSETITKKTLGMQRVKNDPSRRYG
jgi:hypothetical protein